MVVYKERALWVSQTIHNNVILACIDDEWTYDAADVCSCWDHPEAHISHHSGKELSEKDIHEAECCSDANLSTQGEHLYHDVHVWGGGGGDNCHAGKAEPFWLMVSCRVSTHLQESAGWPSARLHLTALRRRGVWVVGHDSQTTRLLDKQQCL